MKAETCNYCGKPIPTRTGLKSYCDPICKAKDLRAVTKCKTCKRPISYLLSRPKPKYCGAECKESAQVKNFCAICGEETRKVYCSKECHDKALKVRKNCANCGKEFSVKKSAGYKRFCSPECKHEYFYIVTSCAFCGAKLEKLKTWTERNSKAFCDRSHSALYYGNFKRE